MRHRILSALTAALLAAALLITPALAVVDPPANTYVGDYADVLTADTEDYLIRKNETLTAATGGAIVVVTVDFLDGMDIADYAYAIFNDWGIGDSEADNGLLLLLATGEEDYYALQGTGLTNALTSAKLDSYLWDYLEDDFAAENYDAGVRKVFDAFYGWYESFYGGLDTAQGQPSGGSQSGASQAQKFHYEPETRNDRMMAVVGPFAAAVVVGILLLAVILACICDGLRWRSYRRRYLMPGMPPPPYVYRPFLFGRTRYRRPPPPRGPGGFGGMGGPRPPMSGSRPSGGWSGFGGGSTRGGGAGRRPGGFSGGSFGGIGRSSGAGRSAGSFRGGGARGGFGGGHSRGGGAGRRR